MTVYRQVAKIRQDRQGFLRPWILGSFNRGAQITRGLTNIRFNFCGLGGSWQLAVNLGDVVVQFGSRQRLDWLLSPAKDARPRRAF